MTDPPAMTIKKIVEKTMIANGLLVSLLCITVEESELTLNNPPSGTLLLRILTHIYTPSIHHLHPSSLVNMILDRYMMWRMNRFHWKSNMLLQVWYRFEPVWRMNACSCWYWWNRVG